MKRIFSLFNFCRGETMSETTKVVKTHVPDSDFVKAYAACTNYSDLARLTGLTKASVASRANKLRKAGVKLVKYARVAKETDVTGLNALLG